MDTVKVKNDYKSPVCIGSVIVYRGSVYTVDKKDWDAWKETSTGAFMIDKKHVAAVDQDSVDQAKTEREAMVATLRAEIEADFIQKDVHAEVVEDYTTIIGELDEKNDAQKEIIKLHDMLVSDLQLEVASLKAKIEELESAPVDEADAEKTTLPEVVDPSDEFVFNPAIHHVEHRGAGKFYVMHLEERIGEPLSQDDKEKYEAISKKYAEDNA